MLRRLRGVLGRLVAVRYDASFFTDDWFTNWSSLAPVLADLLTYEGRWKSFLDFGCGPGVMVDYMNDRGFHYVGCELAPEPRALYLKRYGRHFELYVDSLDAAGGRYDVLVLFDVLEHLRDEEIASLLERTAGIPEILANVSREPNIPGHVNLKSDDAWVRFFNGQGWEYERDRTRRLRERYLELRPGGPDLWHMNLFVWRRRDP